MWLEAMSPRVDAEDCKAFQAIYEKMLVKFAQLQAENNRLKEQASEAESRKEQINRKFSLCCSLLTKIIAHVSISESHTNLLQNMDYK